MPKGQYKLGDFETLARSTEQRMTEESECHCNWDQVIPFRVSESAAFESSVTKFLHEEKFLDFDLIQVPFLPKEAVVGQLQQLEDLSRSLREKAEFKVTLTEVVLL